MIEITSCGLEEQINETPTFEVSGIYYDEEFHCKVELRLNILREEATDYEHVEGVDLGPEGFDILEELVDEIFATEGYQEALEAFQSTHDELDCLFD